MARCRKEKSSDAGVKFFEISRDQFAMPIALCAMRTRRCDTACRMSESAERGTRPARPLWRRAPAFRGDALPYLISPLLGSMTHFAVAPLLTTVTSDAIRPLVSSRPALMAGRQDRAWSFRRFYFLLSDLRVGFRCECAGTGVAAPTISSETILCTERFLLLRCQSGAKSWAKYGHLLPSFAG